MPVDPNSGIFWERQLGGLCRMHSLNAYFGKSLITPQIFNKYIAIYNEFLSKRFNVKINCKEFDLVNSDQTNLVSYIMKRHGVHLRYYALNTLFNKPIDDEIHNAKFFFMYNFGHIWFIKKHNNTHYKVDSLSGVTLFNLSSLNRVKEIGIMVPVDLHKEFIIQLNKLHVILKANNILTKLDTIRYLTMLRKQKQILGDIEIPLGVAISILETRLWQKKDKTEFVRVEVLINNYNEFLQQFTNKNYSNLALILRYVPDVLFELINLQT